VGGVPFSMRFSRLYELVENRGLTVDEMCYLRFGEGERI